MRSKPLGWMRKTSFAFAFAGLFVVVVLLNIMDQTSQRESVLSTIKKNYSWENPPTRISANIDSVWKHSAQPNGDNQQVYTFSERSDHAAVILAKEQAPGFSLDDYVSAFQKGTIANMRFSDGGRFFSENGHQTWKGTGSLTDTADSRLSVQVVQIGPAFWRVVTIQTLPYDYSDAMVGQISDALWSTVN